EPPEHVKFLLATTDPQKLPITVLSRCLQFNLRKMRPADISCHLADVLTKEQVSFQPEALAMIAKAADGSMRDAMSITDQAISFGEDEVHAESVQTMLGLVQTQTLYPLVDALKADDAQAMIDAVRDAAASVPDFLQLNQELIALFHRIALYQQLPDAVDQTDEMDVERLDAYAQSWTAEQVQLFYQITLSGHQDLIRAPDPAIAFEMLMLRLMVFIPEAVKAKKSKAGEQKARSSAQSQPVKQASPDAIATQAPVSRDQSQVGTRKRPEPVQLTQPPTPKAEQKSNPYAERSGDQDVENNRPEDQAQQAATIEVRSVEGSDSSAQLEPVQPKSTGQQIAPVAGLPNQAARSRANVEKKEPISDAAQQESEVDLWRRFLTSGPESKFACFEQLINVLQLPQAVVNLLSIMDVAEVNECSMALHVSQQDDIWYDEAHMRAFEQALAEYIGSAIAVGVEWQTGSVDNLRAFQKQRSQDRQAAMEERFMSDPMVRFAIDELGGVVDMSSIVPISE
ncbi:MAG: hypothetical protein SVC26_08370, partial [Pseudomonadota bacterium]|nr:hypothetical protein [Pseudomonadota bacterium]